SYGHQHRNTDRRESSPGPPPHPIRNALQTRVPGPHHHDANRATCETHTPTDQHKPSTALWIFGREGESQYVPRSVRDAFGGVIPQGSPFAGGGVQDEGVGAGAVRVGGGQVWLVVCAVGGGGACDCCGVFWW